MLIAGALIFPTLSALAAATHWSTASIRWNAALYWVSIASYEFLLILFTRLRPRWLTLTIAIILILPILSASVFLPLAALFNPPPVTTAVLGDHLISERTPWGSGPLATTGTDLTVYYQPAWAPFLHRRRRSARYFGGQCDAAGAYAVLQPDHESVLMCCPASPDQPPDSGHHLIVKLD